MNANILNAATRILILAVLALFSLGLTSGCHRSENKPSESESVRPKVHTVQPKTQTIVREVKQPGYLRAYEQTPIYSKISGFVQEVKVDKGYPIKKGDLLAKLRVPEMESALLACKARVAQAEADVQQALRAIEAAEATVKSSEANITVTQAGQRRAEAERERWRAEVVRADDLLKKHVYDQQTHDEAVNQFKASDAAVHEAEAKIAAANAAYLENQAKKRKAEADRDSTEARLRVLKADQQQQEDWLSYAYLRAPYDGVVTQRSVHTEHFVQANTSGSNSKTAEPLFMVMRTDILRVTVQVPEKDAGLVKQAANVLARSNASANEIPSSALLSKAKGQGSPVVVRLPSMPGHEFPGTVTLDSWAYDESARTLSVEILLDNPMRDKDPDNEFHVNMYADVVIKVERPNVLALPAAAVLTDGNQDYCFQVKDGKIVRTLLKLGVRNEEWVQVFDKQEVAAHGELGGWTPFSGQEAIVTTNPGALLDGQEVQVE